MRVAAAVALSLGVMAPRLLVAETCEYLKIRESQQKGDLEKAGALAQKYLDRVRAHPEKDKDNSRSVCLVLLSVNDALKARRTDKNGEALADYRRAFGIEMRTETDWDRHLAAVLRSEAAPFFDAMGLTADAIELLLASVELDVWWAPGYLNLASILKRLHDPRADAIEAEGILHAEARTVIRGAKGDKWKPGDGANLYRRQGRKEYAAFWDAVEKRRRAEAAASSAAMWGAIYQGLTQGMANVAAAQTGLSARQSFNYWEWQKQQLAQRHAEVQAIMAGSSNSQVPGAGSSFYGSGAQPGLTVGSTIGVPSMSPTGVVAPRAAPSAFSRWQAAAQPGGYVPGPGQPGFNYWQWTAERLRQGQEQMQRGMAPAPPNTSAMPTTAPGVMPFPASSPVACELGRQCGAPESGCRVARNLDGSCDCIHPNTQPVQGKNGPYLPVCGIR